MKSPAEMQKAFEDLPEGIENTSRIANRCSAKIKFGENNSSGQNQARFSNIAIFIH